METCGREESAKTKPLFSRVDISLGAETLVQEVERQEVPGLTRTSLLGAIGNAARFLQDPDRQRSCLRVLAMASRPGWKNKTLEGLSGLTTALFQRTKGEMQALDLSAALSFLKETDFLKNVGGEGARALRKLVEIIEREPKEEVVRELAKGISWTSIPVGCGGGVDTRRLGANILVLVLTAALIIDATPLRDVPLVGLIPKPLRVKLAVDAKLQEGTLGISGLTAEEKKAFEFDKEAILKFHKILIQYPDFPVPEDDEGSMLWKAQYGITAEDVELMRRMSEEEATAYLEEKMANPKLVVPLNERTKWFKEKKNEGKGQSQFLQTRGMSQSQVRAFTQRQGQRPQKISTKKRA